MRDINKLKEIARELRIDIITMVYNAQSGHPGGSLSAIDILTVLYFGGFLRYDPKNLGGKIETDLSSQKDMHLLPCTQF